jgi:hypothetical protein
LEFLSLEDFVLWDSAITNKEARNSLKTIAENLSASKWKTVDIDFGNINLTERMLNWFDDRKLLKHEIMTIWYMSHVDSAEAIHNCFKDIRKTSVISLKVVACRLSRNVLTDFSSFIKEFTNMRELTLQDCFDLTDTKLSGIQRILKQLTKFELIRCNQEANSRRFELLDAFLNSNLEHFCIASSFDDGHSDINSCWSSEVAQRFVAKRKLTLKSFHCGDTEIVAQPILFSNFNDAKQLTTIVLERVTLPNMRGHIVFNPNDITALFNARPNFNTFTMEIDDIFKLEYINNENKRSLLVAGSFHPYNKVSNFQGFELGAFLSFNNELKELRMENLVIREQTLSIILRYYGLHLVELTLAFCKLLCSDEEFISFVKNCKELKMVKMTGTALSESELCGTLRDLGLLYRNTLLDDV